MVDERLVDKARVSSPVSHVRLENVAYAAFTSGTTGSVKCILVEHRSFSTGALAHTAALNLTCSSRVLQFASYSFDACLVETLSVLIVGGCICIPSKTERRTDLIGAARRFEINLALLTPSTARIIDVGDLPTLKTLVLGKEAMSQDDMLKWARHVQLFTAYGPAECSVIAATHRSQGPDGHPTNIGYGTGASCWIVDENDSERLLPPGAVGEILIYGPIVSRGYARDAQQTTKAFIPCPRWLPNVESGHGQRFYKTGDLAKYLETDGSIQFVGRKDAQAKIHGQRIELGSVEYHVRQCLSSATVITVEVVVPANENDSQLLAAFSAFGAQSSSKCSDDLSSCQAKDWPITPSDEFRSQVHTAKRSWAKEYPPI